MKIIDISGFGHSGKTAVTDLLREVDGLNVHDSSFEFNLLRLPDGLIDLKRNIIDNWSPSKSDFAIKRFLKFTNAISSNFSEQLGVDFNKHTREFFDSLIVDVLEINWYDSLYTKESSQLKSLIKKLLEKYKLTNTFRTIRKSIIKNNSSKKDLVYLIDQDLFQEKVICYLENIFGGDIEQLQTIVTNNAFEPFNPVESMSFFTNAYCVIVDRDPRDIYLSSIASNGLFIPGFEKNNSIYSLKYLMDLKKDMLGSSNIETFILRHKQYRKNIKFENDNNHIIRINYEDLIYNYDRAVSTLFDKLQIESSKHINKFMYFNPKKSKKNIGLWKKQKKLMEIVKIENELSEYLYE